MYLRQKLWSFQEVKLGLGSQEVEIADDYVYLGVTFNYNVSFRKAISKHVTQAMFALLEKSRILRLPVDFGNCLTNVFYQFCCMGSKSGVVKISVKLKSFTETVYVCSLKTFNFTPNCMICGGTGRTDMKTRMWNMISSPATPTVWCVFSRNLRIFKVTLSMPSQSKKIIVFEIICDVAY